MAGVSQPCQRSAIPFHLPAEPQKPGGTDWPGWAEGARQHCGSRGYIPTAELSLWILGGPCDSSGGVLHLHNSQQHLPGASPGSSPVCTVIAHGTWVLSYTGNSRGTPGNSPCRSGPKLEPASREAFVGHSRYSSGMWWGSARDPGDDD